MPDRGLSLVLEYRHWRASLPCGAFIILSAYLFTVHEWPEIVNSPSGAFSEAAAGGVSWLASPIAVWALLIALALMLGSWWGDCCSWIVALAQRASLRGIPLEENCSKWTRLQRMRLPLRVSELQQLQSAMRLSPDYSDLQVGDRRGAYTDFLRESFNSPYATLEGSATEPELVRSVTDLRLLASLLPWLPLSFVGIALNVDGPELDGFVGALLAAAGVAFVTLTVGATRQARSSASLAVRMTATPELLGHYARNSQHSGMPANEVREAQHGLFED